MTDAELKNLVASLAIAQQKNEVQFAEIMAEVAEQHKKTETAIAEVAEQHKKTDIQLAKTDAQLAKTSAKVDKVAMLVGNLANNQGDSAEEFF